MPRVVAAIFALTLASVASAAPQRRVFTEDTTVFCNPGQGWSTMGCNAEQYAGVVNIGQVYHRPTWRDFEPQEGVYNWTKLDKLLAYAAQRGIPAAFRIMCVCSGSSVPSSPDWVWAKGAKFEEWENLGYDGNVHTNRAPIFDDPIFLAAHRRFIQALAARYDGDPRLAGIDLGSYGNWGEWHCGSLPPVTPRFLPRDAQGRIRKDALKSKGVKPHVYPLAVRRQYVDMYLDNFRKTPLIFMTDDHECLKYALGEGPTPRVGLRRDGVGSPWHFGRWIGTKPYDAIPRMADVWRNQPIWLEFYGDLATTVRDRFKTLPFSVEWLLTNHVSVVNTCPANPHRIKDDVANFALLKKIDLYAGARLVPQSVEVTRSNGAYEVVLRGENRGVAPIHLPFAVQFALVDAKDKDIVRAAGQTDPSTWLPGPFVLRETVTFPSSVEGRLVLRLVHRHGVFRNFRFAAQETLPDGALPLE